MNPNATDTLAEHVQLVRLSDMAGWERNPHKHPESQLSTLASLVRRFGFTSLPVLATYPGCETGFVSSGNGRLAVLRLLKSQYPQNPPPGIGTAPDGEWLIPCRPMAFPSKAEAEAQGLSDNWVASMPGVEDDTEMLAEILHDLQEQEIDFSGLGKDIEDLSKLLADDANNALAGAGSDSAETTGDNETPAEDAGPVHSKQGEIYQLGPHLLLCGDCRNPDDVRRLLSGSKVNLAFTSPPYASQRKYDETSGFKPIPPDEYVAWFEAVQANVREHLAPDGSWFVNIKEHCDDGQRSLYVKDLTIAHVRQWKWRFVDELCWARSAMPMQMKHAIRFKNEWEPVFQFSASAQPKFRPDAAMLEAMAVPDRHAKRTKTSTGSGFQTGFGADCGDKVYPTNLLWIEKEGSSVENHSATFPVGLPLFFIKAYTDPGDVVYEPFCGSGTTLVASDKEGRVCRGIEISPKYCDVIRRRWTAWAKKNNREVGTGGLE